MWDIIKYYTSEKRNSSRILWSKNSFTLSKKIRQQDFIFLCCLLEKSKTFRVFTVSSLHELASKVDSENFISFCPNFSLAGVQTRLVEDSIVLTNREFLEYLSARKVYTNGTQFWVYLTVNDFSTFFLSFFKIRNFLPHHCLLYNCRRDRFYTSGINTLGTYLKRGNVMSFQQQSKIFRIQLERFCRAFFPTMFFFIIFLFLLVTAYKSILKSFWFF